MSRHMFSQVPHIYRPRSQFSRDHTHLTTMDTGYLTPIYVDEVLPGDTKRLTDVHFARLATPIFAPMDDLWFNVFYFFVPMRLVWEHAENFFFQREDPLDDLEKTDYVMPTVTIAKKDVKSGDIFDQMGLPVINDHFTGSVTVNSLPLRCYNRIFNDWFRDQNLQSPLPHNRGDSGDKPEDFKLVRRGKRHDMFTSAAPSPQLGDPIKISFGEGSFPVVGNGHTVHGTFGASAGAYPGAVLSNGSNEGALSMFPDGGNVRSHPFLFSQSADTSDGTGLVANLGDLAVTVEQWRQAVATQLLMERLMIGGHRYVETLFSIFGVTSPDGRMQRAEYLGGSQTLITTTPITQTSGTTATSPQGNIAGMSTCSHAGRAFTRTFTEHGYIIGLAQVNARLTYSQGLNKLWSRKTPYDWWWPYWDNLGEEAIKTKELYCTGVPSADDVPFGYQERGYEWRYFPDTIAGRFRPDTQQNLAAWHYSQVFDKPPKLNASFIEDNPPVKRTLAVQDEPEILLNCKFVQTDSREMSLYSVPGVGKHF